MADKYNYMPYFRPNLYNYKKKSDNQMYKIKYMLARTRRMFEYFELPETIPARMLELYLQINGFAGFYRYKGYLYAFYGGLGGKPDDYYMPTILTINNPALNLSVNAKIHEDCEIVINDSLLQGLMPMFNFYATGLIENELSMNIASINSRIISLIKALSDRDKASADEFIRKIIDGDLAAISEQPFLEGIQTQPYGDSSRSGIIRDLIEYEQYLKAGWYNDLGLNANFNMKRETLTASENGMNRDSLLPLIDDMLACRQEGLEKVNAMFGTNISVKLSSAWEDNAEELELLHKALEQDVDNSVDIVDNNADPEEVLDDDTQIDT